MSIIKDNLGWLEYTYEKIGNHITLSPIGYKKVASSHSKYPKALLLLNVTNHGLSDQIHDDQKIRINNKNLKVDLHHNGGPPEFYEQVVSQRMATVRSASVLGVQEPHYNFFFLNGLKARSSKVFEIPVYLVSPKGYKHFYEQFTGPLQTTFEFKEFVTSTNSKYEVLSFKKLE